jgi:pimeloyl-ACP methyl ester carboxylesterase
VPDGASSGMARRAVEEAQMRTVRTGDGRDLAVEDFGEPGARPVFLLHGTPESRLCPRPSDTELAALGVRLITFDRAGYGASSPDPGRTVASAAADVAAIADALGLGTFAVAGVSGGGPHALACAALLADRVTRAACVCGPAPFDAEGLDFYAGMSESNIEEFGAAVAGREQLAALLAEAVASIRENPDALLDAAAGELSSFDREMLEDPSVRAQFARDFGEAVRVSADGWIDDDLAFVRPWGFDPAAITVPTTVWHGAADVLVPLAHAEWNIARIPGARADIVKEAGHLNQITAMPGILRWLLDGGAEGDGGAREDAGAAEEGARGVIEP